METQTQGLLDSAKKFFGWFGGMQPDPAPSRAAEVWRTIDEAISNTATYREEIQKLRDFFNGDQITGTGLNASTDYIPDWPDETEDEKETRAERMDALAWNRIRDGVMTHADALYASGKGHSIRRDVVWDEDPDESTKAMVEDFFRRRVWRPNRMTKFMWEVWSRAGSERHAIVMPLWRDGRGRRLSSFPEGMVDKGVHKEWGVVWYEMLDNLTCVPLPDPETPRELGALIHWYLDPEQGNPLISTSVAQPGNRETITELITDKLWFRFRGTDLIQHKWGYENRYGDVRDLAVWVRNPGDVSDSEDAIAGQVLLLEHIYNSTEIHRGHAFPETLYRGYDPPMTTNADGEEVLRRGPNVAHQALDPHADIIKVGPPANLSDVGLAEATIHQMLDDALAISGSERGTGSQLGQLRSAPSISKLTAKSERRRRRKVLWAMEAEENLFRSALRIFSYHSFPPEQRHAFDGCRLDVHFPEDAFGMDTYTEAQRETLAIQAGNETLEDQIRSKNPEASEEEIAAKVEDAKKEIEAKKPKPASTNPSAADKSKAQE